MGGAAASTTARERALDILRTYAPAPLREDVRCELRRIVTHADRQLRG